MVLNLNRVVICSLALLAASGCSHLNSKDQLHWHSVSNRTTKSGVELIEYQYRGKIGAEICFMKIQSSNIENEHICADELDTNKVIAIDLSSNSATRTYKKSSKPADCIQYVISNKSEKEITCTVWKDMPEYWITKNLSDDITK